MAGKTQIWVKTSSGWRTPDLSPSVGNRRLRPFLLSGFPTKKDQTQKGEGLFLVRKLRDKVTVLVVCFLARPELAVHYKQFLLHR